MQPLSRQIPFVGDSDSRVGGGDGAQEMENEVVVESGAVQAMARSGGGATTTSRGGLAAAPKG
jgi:hypothetical protein